ncbi:MAG: YraN family protein [Deltaproteobacteria bacterium]|nr:YraN family protein [Deltaproteobacteria bacterium]
MTAEHLSLGAEGEDRAAAYLRRRGYRIVARNVRAGGVEIDLIVRRGAVIAFVEVKTRRSLAQGPPELAVDARKTARLLRGAAAWLQGRPGRACEVRFDVIACEYDRRGHWHLRHLEAAFDAGP